MKATAQLPLARWQGLSLLVSGLMIVNALLAFRLFPNGEFNAALCAIVALVVLLPHLIAIVCHDWRTGRRHMNELVLIAVTAAAARGDAAGFVTGAAIAFFLLIGLMIENRSASGAQTELAKIAEMTAGRVRRINPDGSETELVPSELTPGDIIRLRPGEVIPADGLIVSGNSTVQEANITGESLPIDKAVNDPVFAGTVNLSGAPDIRITTLGGETVIGKVQSLILDAERSRPAFVRMVDVYAKYYTPLVLILAFFIWLAFDHDWSRVVTVLVAACPIALVLSTPSAAVAAVSSAARVGILIKNVAHIEVLSGIRYFMFDKTGTLTTGSLEVIRLAPVEGIDSETLLAAACSAGQHSNHPVSVAVCALGRQVHIPLLPTDNWTEVPGRGIRCGTSGGTLCSGNLDWMVENGGTPATFREHADESNAGMSLLYVLKDGAALGWIALRDRIRDDAKPALSKLRNTFAINTLMVTGDRDPVARQVAAELGIEEFHSHCKPTEKTERVEQFKADGSPIAFIGDGVNDGPALAAADIGIAMGAAGSSLAIETASIALMNNKLDRLPYLCRLSAAYRRLMIQNFIVGILIIGIGIVLGVTMTAEMSAHGYGAVITAGLQLLGALAVTMNSARLMRLPHP